MPGPTSRRLTPDERAGIIEQRLNGLPVRVIAANFQTTTRTVVAVTKWYLEEQARAFSAKTDATLQKLITRHLAAAARLEVLAEQHEEAGDAAASARYMAEARARLQEVAKLSGMYVERVESTSTINIDVKAMSDEELRALLGES